MGNMEAVARVISRAEWFVLATSLMAFVAIGGFAGVVYRALERKGPGAAAATAFLAVYAAAVLVYARVFEHQYTSTWTDLLQSIPGPHGATDAALASRMAKDQISGLRHWPPAMHFFAYPAWTIIAIPSVLFVSHVVWLFIRRSEAITHEPRYRLTRRLRRIRTAALHLCRSLTSSRRRAPREER